MKAISSVESGGDGLQVSLCPVFYLPVDFTVESIKYFTTTVRSIPSDGNFIMLLPWSLDSNWCNLAI
jgi:hypothetical protein